MQRAQLVRQGPHTVGPVGRVHVADAGDAGAGGQLGVRGAGGVAGALNAGGDLLPGGPAEGAGGGPGEVVVGAGGARPLARVVRVGQGEGGAGGVVGANHLVQLVDIYNNNNIPLCEKI